MIGLGLEVFSLYFEEISLVAGIAISSLLCAYIRYKLRKWKKEKMPSELLDMIKKVFRILRPGYVGVLLAAMFARQTPEASTWSAYLFMFGVGLILGDDVLSGTVVYRVAEHIKEVLESELEHYRSRGGEGNE